MEKNLINKRTVGYSLQPPKYLIYRAGNMEKESTLRDSFMHDRDRILYSKAFRRLAGKTQVYVAGVDDHVRTRLTHTLEVSQIARTIARNLNLNEDLVEAMSLGHDIGHTPYGHAGERILHEFMTPHENHQLVKCPLDRADSIFEDSLGFKHNLQSVKTTITSEKNYGEFGLNLTNFTLFGMWFHSEPTYGDRKNNCSSAMGYYDRFKKYLLLDNQNYAWSFEAFVVREADEIAQRHHDLEDAVRGKIITKDEIHKLIRDFFGDNISSNENPDPRKDDSSYLTELSTFIVNLLVERLIRSSIINLNALIDKYDLKQITFGKFICDHDCTDNEVKAIISYDNYTYHDDFCKNLHGFKHEISDRLLSSYSIQRADAKGAYIIRKVFQAFYANPQQLPDHSIMQFLLMTHKYNTFENIIKLVEDKGMGHIRHEFDKFNKSEVQCNEELKLVLMRVICDHIAGMTDTYVQKMYQDLYS